MIAKARFIVLLLLLTSLALAACGGGDDDGDDASATPTDLAIRVTSTPTEAANATSTPTEDSATSTPTEEPTETSPTPTATEAESTATATSEATASSSATSTVDQEAGNELLGMMPATEEIPAGLTQTEEFVVGLEETAADNDDPAARKAQLEEWGFAAAARRTFEAEDDSATAGAIFLISEVGMRLSSPEFASAQIEHDFTQLGPASDAPLEPFDIEPLGDESRAAVGESSVQGVPVTIAAVWVRVGNDAFRLGGISTADVDIMSELTTLAGTAFGFRDTTESAPPEIGELVYSTNFSDWDSGEFDAGSISLDGGIYSLAVNPPAGTYVSAFTVNSDLFADVSVSVQMRQVAGPELAEGCVMMRVDPDNQDWDVAFCVSADGHINAVYEEFAADGSYNFETIFETTLDPGFTLDDWRTIQIIGRGNEFWFLIDGVVVGTGQHESPPSGEVGIVVNNFSEENVEFEYQNLEVHSVQ